MSMPCQPPMPSSSTRATATPRKPASRKASNNSAEDEDGGTRVSWSSHEDQLIVQAVQELGPRWCAVAARLLVRHPHVLAVGHRRRIREEGARLRRRERHARRIRAGARRLARRRRVDETATVRTTNHDRGQRMKRERFHHRNCTIVTVVSL